MTTPLRLFSKFGPPARQIFLRCSGPLLVLALGLFLAARFEPNHRWTAVTYLGFATTWWLSLYAADYRLRKLLVRWRCRPRWFATAPLLVAVWLWIAHMPERFDYRQLAVAGATAGLGILAQGILHRHFRRTGKPGAEATRMFVILGLSLWLIHPYATTHLVGGGDAHHYAQQLADAARQARHGVYQLFVGQTSFAFNGDFHPLRTAPYFSYLGAAVSFVTGPSLPPPAIQNLLIVISYCTAVGLLYVLLARLRPGAGWPAFWLTSAFAANPGILALIYSGDMVASWLALPWLPVVFYATIRSATSADPARPLNLLAGALALVWLAHPAIAFWTTALIALPLLAQTFMSWNGGKSLWRLAACGVACLLLCNYVFVSVKTLGLPSDPNLVANVRNGAIVGTLEAGWAGIGRPIDEGGADLTRNLQLSPALWFAGLVGVVGIALGHRHRRIAVPLVLGTAAMLLLLYPSKFLAGRLWSMMPEIVISATDQWPMQRFYPILSVLVPFIALLAWPVHPSPLRRRLAHGLLLILGSAAIFSGYDARKFVARGYAVTSSAEMSDRRLRPENVVLSRYSYEYYGTVPQMFSHGTMNPLMQNRLLARNTLEPFDLNFMALKRPIPGDGPRPRTRHRYVPTEFGGSYEPPLRLEPNRAYFARFLFSGEEAKGTLQLLGRYIAREYHLPLSGAPQAFGIGPQRRNGFSLWTTATEADDVQLRFYAQPGQPQPKNLGDLELLAINPDRLPLQTLSVFPYQVSVRSPAATWLETPKIFINGYEARVDGRPAPVMRSPDGLAMVPIPAGTHRVHLNYVGPAVLRAAFWATLLGWFAYLTVWWLNHRSPGLIERIFPSIGRGALAAVVLGATGFGGTQVYATLKNRPPPPDPATTPVRVEFTLPIGLSPNWEPVWHFDQAGTRWDVYLFYEGSQKIRVGLGRNGKLQAESGLFSINYLRPHRLLVQLSSATDAKNPQLKLWFNHRLVLNSDLRSATGERVVATAPFRGEILRVAPSDGPID